MKGTPQVKSGAEGNLLPQGAHAPINRSGGCPLISLEDVTYIYPRAQAPAVERLSLHIAPGERLAVIGPSGSGKSTLGRLVAGLLEPTSGRILVRGDSPFSSRDLGKKAVAIVFQNPETQLIASTVEEDVAVGPENLGLPSDEIRRRVDEALEALGIAHLAKRPVSTLSGGEKQRVAVAGALALHPSCLVLDEAGAMLHPAARKALEEAITRAVASRGIAVVQITHDLQEAARAGRVVLLHRGRLVASGPPGVVLTDETLLSGCGLEPPEEVRLALALRRRGIPLPEIPLDVAALARAAAEAIAP